METPSNFDLIYFLQSSLTADESEIPRSNDQFAGGFSNPK